MRRISAALVAAIAAVILLIPATAQAAPKPPTITWGGVTIQPLGAPPLQTGCTLSQQNISFTVTGIKGNPRAAWNVLFAASQNGTVLTDFVLQTLQKGDNGAALSIPVGPGTIDLPFGNITFNVSLLDPSGNAVANGQPVTLDCLALP